MKSKHLVILNGHPDPAPERFCAALGRAYADGARISGWQATQFNVGQIAGDRHAAATPDLAIALKASCAADRLAIVYPVWLGLPPDCLTYFLRLAARLSPGTLGRIPAHVAAAMDMPALLYRKQTRRDEFGQVLPITVSLTGIAVERHTMIGSVSAISLVQRQAWLGEIRTAAQTDTSQHGAPCDVIFWERLIA